MKHYMLDTNIVSHFLKAHHNVTKNVTSKPIPSICISAITKGELQYGVAKRPEAKRLHLVVEKFLQYVDVLPWDSAIAKRYGVVRAEMEKHGNVLAPLDMLIAAHALETGVVLVTNDKAFKMVSGLHTEDWLD
ncbi:MAG: type II toxin-antitoxin system VapC family toxin [Gammaproteobacteria bacterium]